MNGRAKQERWDWWDHFFCLSGSHSQNILKSRPPCVAKNGAKTSDSTAISLMRMLSDGPDVSFNGSPMVSPITAALCGSDPLGPRDLACSEAPACFKQNKYRAYSHYKNLYFSTHTKLQIKK